MALLNSAVHTREIREKLFDYINDQIGTGHDESLISAEAIAFSNLHTLKRSSFGSAYDHAVRVANCVIYEFDRTDPNLVILSLLHDIVEDGNVRLEDILNIFGGEIHHDVKLLTREPSEDHGEKRGYKKILEDIDLFDEPRGIRLVKCADRIDNLRDMLMIPPTDKRYDRIPRWVAETKISMIPLARITEPIAQIKMSEEIERIDRIFKDEIDTFMSYYLEEMERDGIKIPSGHSGGDSTS